MARYRAPSRRTVLGVAGLGALVAAALVLAPGEGGSAPAADLLLLSPDGTAAPAIRFDAATLERLRSPAPPATAAGADTLGAGPDSAGGDAAVGPGPAASSVPGGSAVEERADTAPAPPTLRVPLVLALRALGERPLSPQSLRLAVPAPFRLAAVSAQRGEGPDRAAEEGGATSGETPGEAGWGGPLAGYSIPLRDVEVSAEDPPTRVSAADTVWLEYDARDLDCVLDGDSVPRFLPASPPHPGALEDVRLFYALAFRGGGRLTGVLRLALEPPVPPPPGPPEPTLAGAGPAELRRGGFALPDTTLRARATYEASCANGARSDPLTVRFLASELGGARAYLIGSVGPPRLRLEDLDGDDVIEREAWDPDADGRFEASRTLRLPLPGVLDAPPRRAFLDRQREALAAQAAAEAARRAAAWRARADSAAAQPSPDSARGRAEPPDGAPERGDQPQDTTGTRGGGR